MNSFASEVTAWPRRGHEGKLADKPSGRDRGPEDLTDQLNRMAAN